MHMELDLVRKQHEKLGLPIRVSPDTRAPLPEIVSRRRLLRVETEDFLNGGLWANDLVQLSIRLGRVAFCVAGTLAQFGIEPDVRDLAEAITQMMTDARNDLDKSLQVSDWPSVKICCVKLELLWYGIAANFGLPYYDLMNMLHDFYMDGEDVNLESVRALLEKAGLPVAPAAANDTGGAA